MITELKTNLNTFTIIAPSTNKTRKPGSCKKPLLQELNLRPFGLKPGLSDDKTKLKRHLGLEEPSKFDSFDKRKKNIVYGNYLSFWFY